MSFTRSAVASHHMESVVESLMTLKVVDQDRLETVCHTTDPNIDSLPFSDDILS